ncbi:PREDICTED: vam6/Vps39-like protein [Rhagoletis zephyria]|uniref:vam6/Vps39-like protein n=1 Tax=Rhagoletis zephyria TaxID=28612 RepID=UPI000811A908|nr:PREDICTED: vam6/Vps39-like protein [Rhagoletis zephyria]XP_017486183.1 PREDICTED: vam6/Vps39-like protein [Rhagoletis zephyria]XP_017486189.1 PREDICTED: vam6/Vps39-like protein [Rhagoletis zephyria]XP_036328868.1 vam6/Vps39-like protein [Rhagoletis pomonella]XP_036328869.1 vam6/Vps39-like protein [Rhagoletis pomonella]XP_036328870.1 vam6/Vps39-like protein [Rhagoletis pomonella]
MHQAYNIHTILKQGVQIESIAAYDNNVILGTRSGQLIMYSVDSNGTVDMLMFNKNFSKKSIVQMEVIPAENLLFVLTDNTVHVCDISGVGNNFTLIHSAMVTKGCTLFALDVKPTKLPTGEMTTVIGVCCAIKRQLQFFYWKQDKLNTFDFNIELKDVPKAICWVDDAVCIGFKDEYVIYNMLASKPEKHDLIVTSSSHSMDPCICLIKHNMLGVSKDEYLVAIDPSVYVKKNDEKLKTYGTIEAAVGNVEIKNKPKPMMWSSALLDIVWDEPYVIGRVANAIEVRCIEGSSLNKDTLVQTIPELSKTKLLVRSGKGTLFAAANSELWCIRMVDIPTQRQILLQQKKFQLAIGLTNISEEPEDIKAATIREIHVRYARELFANKQFADSMKEFEKAAADPYDVIRLFPNLLQDQASKSNEASVPAPLMPQLEEKDMENALLALIEFLALARQKEVVKLRDTKSTSKSLLSIIDTTLLKCYLQTNDSLVAPLLRLNQCHLEESEKTLKKHDKISELIILYQMNGKHKKALELLKAQASVEGSSLYGHDRTIKYLQQLGSPQLPLIFEFCDWVLKEAPDDGLRIFTDNFIEVENLPRANVLDFLLSRHKALVIPYLEHVINVWKDNNTLLHNVLAKQYREKVHSLLEEVKQEEPTKQSESQENLRKYRENLCEFLKNSQNYSPEVVLRDFPTNDLLEERALILGRLKKHEEVLSIYVQVLGDVEKAAEYCEANYEDDKNIFATLLMTLLNPSRQPPYEDVALHPDFLRPNEEIILGLLNKYAEKIDPYVVIPLLPDDMPVHSIWNYLEIVLRTEIAERHENETMARLLKAEIRRVREEIRAEENKSVVLTEFTVCPQCKKRFTNPPAFVRYPNGEVVHLSCHDKLVQSSSGNSS